MRRKRISTAHDSDRVPEEEFKAQVSGFLWAAKKEPDNDYHVIPGRRRGRSELLPERRGVRHPATR